MITPLAATIEPDSIITDPVFNNKLPVICTPPKNDALCALNIIRSPTIEAVTEPLANNAAGTFFKSLPSPKNEPVN